VIKDICQ